MYDETTPAPQESHPDAAEILRAAGWRPHDGWGVYTRDTLVMGFQPDGLAFHVKNWAKVMPGDPQYGPDTPDTPAEAAAWLVEHVQRLANPLSTEATLNPFAALDAIGEIAQIALADEGERVESREHVAVQEEALSDPGDREHYLDESNAAPNAGADQQGPSGDYDAESESSGSVAGPAVEPIDADFTESDAYDEDVRLALEGPDDADPPLLEFGEEMAEAEAQDQAGGQFIFGDNLDQKRTAAIGLVMRYARSITPDWDEVADQQLASMRNFAMGVSEGRWPDDATMRDELGALEGTLRTIHAIEAVTRDKVAFLEAAGREEIEAFVVEAGWP